MVVHGTGQHNEILEEVIAGNPDNASDAMKDHLEKYFNGLIEMEKKYRDRMKIK
jgi:DNA-binding GntR family transcriptional regulator